MINKSVEKDERTTFIENASYKIGYNFISFALLLDVVYRSLVYKEAPWDLLGLVIIGGLIMTLYQLKHKILGKYLIKISIVTIVTSFIMAFILAFIFKKL